jgi:hypothetical protein
MPSVLTGYSSTAFFGRFTLYPVESFNMTKWEYKVEYFPPQHSKARNAASLLESILEDHGREEWELVSTLPTTQVVNDSNLSTTECMLIFKRPLRKP